MFPQTEPEIIEETNIDRVNEPRGYARSRQVKGHSETSTLSSQPSIDEVRQQMHMLLEEAFSLASAGHAGQSRHQEAYGSTQHLPYSEVVTSAPGTMTRPRAGVQWVPTYRPEMYQYSLPRPVSQRPTHLPSRGHSRTKCSNGVLRAGASSDEVTLGFGDKLCWALIPFSTHGPSLSLLVLGHRRTGSTTSNRNTFKDEFPVLFSLPRRADLILHALMASYISRCEDPL